VNTRIINLFAGPGAGKSTTAAGLFHLMKLRGISVELVTEFAKQMVWQERSQDLKCQGYIHGKQLNKIDMANGKVAYVVTDSPTLLSAIYEPADYPRSFVPWVVDIFNAYDNFNVYLHRTKDYVPTGRLHTFAQALEVDQKVFRFLQDHKIPFEPLAGDEDAVRRIMEWLGL